MAAKPNSTASGSESAAISPHFCLSEDGHHELCDIRGSLNIIADLLDAPGARHDFKPEDMASLFRALARAADAVITASPYLPSTSH